MSQESNQPDTSTIIEISPTTNALVDADMTSDSEVMKEETKALVDAVRKRAQADAQSAGDFTRDAYLNAVRQLRETVEQNKLFDPEQVEHSFEEIQQEAEKNWNSIVKEVTDFGDRLSEAAQTAWDILTHPKDSNTPKD